MAGSMQLSQELRIYRSPVGPNVTGEKRRVQLVNFNLSSRALRRDAWILHIMSSIHGPLSPMPSRRRVLVCKAFLNPGGGSKIPVPEAAALVLKRSCDALGANPLLLKLIPAVGVIALAAWGLGPLVRLGRSVFLQKSDISWEKSSVHYVLTSYVQPLLLWTGATLVCRALDPLVLPSVASQAVKQRLLNFVRSLSTVLAFAYCISSLIQQAQKFFTVTNTNDSSDASNMGFSFAGKAVYTAVWVAAVSLFMELLGYSTQKWVTAGGLGTVLITLAGREILTNFLSSIMVHATRPFVLNEWIQTKIQGYEVSGTVEHVGWWSPTIIRGDDREAVHIPNHKFTVNVVRNLSQKTHWRIKTHLAISHLDVNKINKIVADMRKVLAKNPQVEQQKLHRRVFLENINPDNQALMILVSCFVKTSHFGEYLGVKEVILMDLLRVISHHQARLATPIRTVQKYYSDADLDNVPFDDSIFTRSRAANRPYLLIEPSYKVSDVKVKTPANAAGISEERDAKFEAVPEESSEPPAIPDSRKSKSTATVTSASGANSKVSATQASKTRPRNSVPDNPVQLNLDKTHPSEGTANVSKEIAACNSEEISQGGMQRKSPTTNPMFDSERRANTAAISQTNQESDKSVALPSEARSPMEENLVLDVALEGSKRTLPIDEEIAPSPFPAESKELAASRNGGASSSGAKEKKGGQAPTVKSTSQSG